MTTGMTTTLMNWVSPSAMQSLGWALLHFLWQGTALAALAAAAMAVCRRASTRYLVGVGALALMLFAPVATFFFYSQQHSGVRRRREVVVAARRGRPILREGRSRGEWLGATPDPVFERLFPQCASLAGRSVVAGRGLLQSPFRRRLRVARTGTPQTVHRREPAGSRSLLQPAGSARPDSSD